MRNKKWFIIILAVVAVFLLLSAKKDKKDIIPVASETSDDTSSIPQQDTQNTPQPRGERLFGMGISEGNIGFNKAFTLAQSVGVKVVEIPVSWDDSEPAPEKYVSNWLPIANQFYPKTGTKISISLNPIDTNNLRLPKDLKNKSFNDPLVIRRYKLFVDFVASLVPDSDIFFVAIGNEIDAYLGNSEKHWQEYTEFYTAVASYVRQKFPHAVIGSKITYDGIINLDDKVKRLNDHADIVLVTYYPFKQGGFIVRDPATVHNDFKRITELYPDKKIYVAEIGYPSGVLNGSSEKKQAEFIRETFSAWDIYAERIPFLNFMWMHDASPETVTGWQKYYGLSDQRFASFLGTLGLRTYDGKDKQAFIQFRKEVENRGWK